MDRYYVGSTSDLQVRLSQHNSGRRFHYTSAASDWELRYHEVFGSFAEARRRELEVKRKKSRKYIEWLIAGSGD
ncbi:GIY-YIG nuclease family protein [Parapedobacter koreensis]|uniref:GIY-YIG nuclease family protein n=1 Tax=Parapedobacter koreensis TaxID=332977 RepID=UPI0015A4F89C|nr:GIY-YIG nuclease family protein [Parapedobacter koreensis]